MYWYIYKGAIFCMLFVHLDMIKDNKKKKIWIILIFCFCFTAWDEKKNVGIFMYTFLFNSIVDHKMHKGDQWQWHIHTLLCILFWQRQSQGLGEGGSNAVLSPFTETETVQSWRLHPKGSNKANQAPPEIKHTHTYSWAFSTCDSLGCFTGWVGACWQKIGTVYHLNRVLFGPRSPFNESVRFCVCVRCLARCNAGGSCAAHFKTPHPLTSKFAPGSLLHRKSRKKKKISIFFRHVWVM